VTWRSRAAANNAEWCDMVCRSHGLEGRFDDDAWTCPTRTPVFYPDAVTLVPRPSVPALLARIDSGPGCSVKDSFATLDLSDHGFGVLFDAHWVVCTDAEREPETTVPPWEVVQKADLLASWEEARDEGPSGIFRAELLAHDAVAVLCARREERVTAGAVLQRSPTVVGISNFFTTDGAVDAAWSGCITLANSLFPGSTFVGYESGDALDVVRRHGFEPAGALRVWIRPD